MKKVYDKVVYYNANGQAIGEDDFGYKRLFKMGQSVVVKSRHYTVKRATVKDKIHHVYLEEDTIND